MQQMMKKSLEPCKNMFTLKLSNEISSSMPLLMPLDSILSDAFSMQLQKI